MARRVSTFLLGSISLIALCAPAFAQSNGSIEEVVVTATKRTETVKNIPMSITVLGQDQLNNLNARSYEDIMAQVPGMSISEADATHPQLILEGINDGGDGSLVGTYIDDTPFGSSNALANGTDTAPNLDTYDMKRVEVLRGPQGTLYGAGAEGGVIRFVTNAPDPSGWDDSFELGAMDMAGGGAGASARAMVNAPITDNLAIRIVGFDQRTPGYIDTVNLGLKNDNDLRSFGGRASILYQPTNKITIRLNAMQQQIDSGNLDAVDEEVLPNGKFTPLYGNYKQERDVLEPDGARYFLYNGTVNWDFDFATLTSATSYGILHDYQFEDDEGLTIPATGLPLNVQGFVHQDKFTQEVRLASDPGQGPIDWLAGFYYTLEDTSLHQDYAFTFHNAIPYNLQLDSTYIETTGFANVTYHILPSLDLTAGGRYAHDDQTALEFGTLVGTPNHGTSSENAFTWSGELQYHIDDQTNVYARAATGFRPGGPNALPPAAAGVVPQMYHSDTLTDYEVGSKSDLLEGRLSFDVDAFYIDWKNIQLLSVYTVATGPGAGQYAIDANGGGARSYGAEGNLVWTPIDRLTLDLNAAYIDAQLTADTPAAVGGFTGNYLPYTPKWGTTLTGDYHFLPVGDWTPFVGATWHYVGDRSSGFTAGYTQATLPEYNTVDLRVGVDWSEWELELYAKNLTSAKGITSASAYGGADVSNLAPTAAYIAPRLVGIVLRGKF
jgi:iron complex outermembrane recepter protein